MLESMTPATFFSADYFEARDKFLRAAARRALKVVSHVHPHAKGPGGEDLYVDVATWGADSATSAMLAISGAHGVEGYAGSAIQIGWLSRQTDWPEDQKLILIHALNPYGFAWNRRVTEDNVDLNRNFVDHAQPYPPNKDYEGLKDAIAPANLNPETLEASSKALRGYAREHGAFAMQETISKGQYIHPEGMYYGGTREQWSAGLFRHIVRREMAHCRRAAVIDIHTGLGAYGDAELISEEATSSPAYARARRWWGDTVQSTVSGDSVSAQVCGSLDSSVPALLSHAEATMICLEYGTYSTLEVFQALRADNWLHTKGDPASPAAKEIKAQVRRAFYPDQDDWKEKVWKRGESGLAQAGAGLSTD